MARVRTSLVGLGCVVWVFLGADCQYQTPTSVGGRRETPPVVHVREVRVLLVSGDATCRIRVDGPVTIRSAGAAPPRHLPHLAWSELSVSKGQISMGDGHPLASPIIVLPRNNGTLWLARRSGNEWVSRCYPGNLHVSADPGGNRLTVINDLDVETYVACVVPGEIYPDFHPQAYRAQAVAARTYALYEMARRSAMSYDVVATEASQVYVGLQNSGAAERARRAVDETRGVVATWSSPAGERIFCTFYSSCCGGMTQDVNNCKPDFPGVPPLHGGVRCEFCKVAPAKTYRWGPVGISKSELTSKLVARYPRLTALGRIERLQVIDQTRAGRAKKIRLVGASGATYDLVAEDFRLAAGARILRSTHFDIQDDGESFVFANGRGFGHGMGLCQWGMQGMALAGHRADEILKYYYPTMHLTRAY